MAEYDARSETYAALAQHDPVKQYVQYPNALQLLGDVAGRRVLDIGCGDGTFSRMLARSGATVVGYDPSEKQIAIARAHELQEPLGIEYEVSQNLPPKWAGTCSAVVSVMVLLYARTPQELQAIFSDARLALEHSGRFCSVSYNPNFKRLDRKVYNRVFERIGERVLKVHFLAAGGGELMSATAAYFSQAEHERAIQAAGFDEFSWKPLSIAHVGVAAMGESFWDGFLQDAPYIGLVASVPAT